MGGWADAESVRRQVRRQAGHAGGAASSLGANGQGLADGGCGPLRPTARQRPTRPGRQHELVCLEAHRLRWHVGAIAGGKKVGGGRPPIVPAPQRLREGTYNLEVDRFPCCSSPQHCAPKEKGRTLWEKYDNGDNLLFKEADLRAPLKSHLFLDLTRLTDPGTFRWWIGSSKALRGDLASTPLLENVMPESKPTPAPSAHESTRRRRTLAAGKAFHLCGPHP